LLHGRRSRRYGSGERKRVHFYRAGAVAKPIEVNSGLRQETQQQIRHRDVLRIDDVATALQLPAQAARNDDGQLEMVMNMAVAHAASVENHRMVEQIPV